MVVAVSIYKVSDAGRGCPIANPNARDRESERYLELVHGLAGRRVRAFVRGDTD